MKSRFTGIATTYPKAAIFIIAAITIFFASQMHRLRMETNIEEMLPKKDSAYINKKLLEKVFGVKDMLIIGIINDGEKGIYNMHTLTLIKKITDKLRDMKGINAITKDDLISISTLDNITGTEDGMDVTPFMKEVPENEEEIEKIKKAIFDNDMFVGTIFSKDEKATMIMAELEDDIHPGEVYFNVKKYIDEEIGKDIPEKIYIAGRPAIEGIFGMYMPKDNQKMMPIVLLLIVVVLFITFRTVRGVLLPLAVVVVAVIWTLSTMALFSIPMFTITNMMPVILIAIGTADGIHLLSKYYDEIIEHPQKSKKEVISAMMDELASPVIMTSVTTAAGFLSNISSEMVPIRYFGIFTALGTIYAMIFSLVFIPAMLMLLKLKAPKRIEARIGKTNNRDESSTVSNFLGSIGQFVHHNKQAVSSLIVVIILILGYGISSLHIDASLLSEFREESVIRKADEALNKKFSGTTNLNILIDTKKDGAIKSPALLKKIDKLQTYLESMDDIGDTLSIAEFVKRMNKVMNENRDEMEVIPDSRELIAQYLLMYSMSGDPEDFDDVVDYNYRQANIRVFLKTDHSKPVADIISNLNLFVKENFKDSDIEVKLAGTAYTMYSFVDIIIRGQIASLVIGLIAIFLLTSLEFRSIVAGFLNIIPVSFSILFNFGLMGLVGIPLEIGTALTGGMAIGVGVDFAIHFINKYKISAQETDDPLEITKITMRTSGKAIFFNAIVVIAGFLVLVNANLYPQVKLGIMVALTMFVCFLSSIVILPILLDLIKPKFIFKKGN